MNFYYIKKYLYDFYNIMILDLKFELYLASKL